MSNANIQVGTAVGQPAANPAAGANPADLQLETAAALERGFPEALLSHVSRVGGFNIVDTPCTAVQTLAANEGVDLNDRDAVARLVDRYWNTKWRHDRGVATYASIVHAQKLMEETGEYMCPCYKADGTLCNGQGHFVSFATKTFAGIQSVFLCQACHDAIGPNPDGALDMTGLDKLFEGPNPPPRFHEQRTYDEMVAANNAAAANPQDPELWALAESMVGRVDPDKNVEDTLKAVRALLPPEYCSCLTTLGATPEHMKLWIIVMKLVRARQAKKKEAAAAAAAAAEKEKEKTAMDAD